MKTVYTDIDIRFSIDGIPLYALNIVFEEFTRAVPAHSHGSGCYEIHYIPCGYGELTANGQSYAITPGTLYVTGPHVEHAQATSRKEPMQEYCVYLKTGGTCRQYKKSPVMEAFVSVPFWIGKDTQGIHRLMERIFDELKQQYIGYQNQVELLLAQLLISVVRNYQCCRASQSVFAKNNISDAQSIMIEEYFLYEYSSLSLNGLADRLKLGPRQTQRLLQEYYGKTFQQKKTEARMSAAVVLLADREKSLAAVAEELGYSSAGHFSNAFCNYYKMTPGDYRKQLKG